MAEKTGIAWTDHTFNPWWGCMKVSPGCTNCYAETFAVRTGHDIWGPAKTTSRRTFAPSHWREPKRWNAQAWAEGGRRRVFCASMADVFEDHPALPAEREKLWNLIRETPALDWQILTKRPENIAAMLPADWGEGYPNVWLGTSVEDQQRADERIPILLRVPAAVRFLSCEPLLGAVDLRAVGNPNEPYLHCLSNGIGYDNRCARVDWVIVGGESGGKRRPMEVRWLEDIVRLCRQQRVAVFVKQDNAFKPDQQGRIPDELFVREFPGAVRTLSERVSPTEESR